MVEISIQYQGKAIKEDRARYQSQSAQGAEAMCCQTTVAIFAYRIDTTWKGLSGRHMAIMTVMAWLDLC